MGSDRKGKILSVSLYMGWPIRALKREGVKMLRPPWVLGCFYKKPNAVNGEQLFCFSIFLWKGNRGGFCPKGAAVFICCCVHDSRYDLTALSTKVAKWFYFDWNTILVKYNSMKSKHIRLHLSALLLTGCVTLGKALPLSKPQFSHL